MQSEDATTVIAAALVALDTALTWYGLRRGGSELNPLLNGLARRTEHWLWLKTAVGLGAVWLAAGTWAEGVLIAAYCGVALWNVVQIARMQ